MITFNDFEKKFKNAYFITWYDALAKRNIQKTVNWLLYFDGKEFDVCPVNSNKYEFDAQHLYCFTFNFSKDFPLSIAQQVDRVKDLLDYDELRELLITREAFTSLDQFVNEDLSTSLFNHIVANDFSKYKIMFNEVIEEMYQGFICSDEYRTFIYQIKDMFKFEDLKKRKDKIVQESIFDMMNFMMRG